MTTLTRRLATGALGDSRIRISGWVQGAAIFVGVCFVYVIFADAQYSSHHVYLAEAMLHGSFDIGSAGAPDYYADTVTVGDSRYVPFPPGPALLLLPFVAIWGTAVSQELFAVVLGAVNAVLLWQVMLTLKVSRRTAVLSTVFFAFGTVHFYAATSGGVWQYSHVAAVFFLLVAILLALHRAPLALVAFVFGFAVLSRAPTLMAAPFFLYLAYRQHSDALSIAGLRNRAWLKDLALFSAGLAPIGLMIVGYNYARFDSLFDSGYNAVSESYIASGQEYTYYRHLFPNSGHFGLFDIRNVPLHIHAMFFLTPDIGSGWQLLKPSPYGMSVLLTSPAFIYAFLVRRKTALKPACWLAIGLVTIPLFLHYAQGWVQFGYRFLLDYAPFLMILTALGFEDNQSPVSQRVQYGLVAWSVAVCTWGVVLSHSTF